MTLGERILELTDYGFAIKFERQNAVLGSESMIVMSITRGTNRHYFAVDPCEFRCAVPTSDIDNFLLETLNRGVRTIIDKENDELAARVKSDGSDK